MRDLVATIFSSGKQLADVCILFFFFMCLLAIVAMQFFQGAMRHRCYSALGSADTTRMCSGDDTDSSGSLGHTCDAGWECLKSHHNPAMGYVSFDNVGSALITIFSIASTDMWSRTSSMVQDATSGWSALYFIVIIFLLTIFTLNLTVAVLASRFVLARLEKQEAMLLLKDANTKPKLADIASSRSLLGRMMEYAGAQHTSTEAPEPVRQLVLAVWAKRVTDHQLFNNLSSGICFLYCGFLAAKHYPAEELTETILERADQVAAMLFLGELVLRLVGESWMEYLSQKRNVLDAVVVILCFVDVWVVRGYEDVAGMRVVRLFRVLQAARAMSRWQTFGRIVEGVQHTFGSMVYFCLLLFLMIMIGALLAMQLFGGSYKPEVSWHESSCFGADLTLCMLQVLLAEQGLSMHGYVYDNRISFDTFPESVLAIFVALTGTWSSLAWSTMYLKGGYTLVFWLVVVVLGKFILLNLLLAVLIDKTSAKTEDDQESESSVVAQATHLTPLNVCPTWTQSPILTHCGT